MKDSFISRFHFLSLTYLYKQRKNVHHHIKGVDERKFFVTKAIEKNIKVIYGPLKSIYLKRLGTKFINYVIEIFLKGFSKLNLSMNLALF